MRLVRLVALALALVATAAACKKSKEGPTDTGPPDTGGPKQPALKPGSRPKVALKPNEMLVVYQRTDLKTGEVVFTKDGNAGPEQRLAAVKPAPKYVDGSPERSEWNHPGAFDRNEVILVTEKKDGATLVTEIRLPPDRGKIGDYGRHVEGRFLEALGDNHNPTSVAVEVMGSRQSFPMAPYVRYYTKKGLQVNGPGARGFFNMPAIFVIESVGGQEVVTEVWYTS